MTPHTVTPHTVSAFDDEFSELDRLTAEMGGLGEKLLADAFSALERRDPQLAALVVASDRVIDRMERRLVDRAVLLIAKRQPVAYDLRHAMAAFKIAGDLERVGDLAKNIGKCALAISSEAYPQQLIGGLRHMSELAQRQLKDVLDAFSARDADQALAVWRNDERLDALYNSVFRELLTYMMEDPRTIGLCTHLLFGAKNMERIGDHTTNIAEHVYFLVTGKALTDRPKVESTSHDLPSA